MGRGGGMWGVGRSSVVKWGVVRKWKIEGMGC